MDFQDSWWNISVPSLVIIAAAVFEISCGKLDRRTDRQTNAAVNPYPEITVGGVGNEIRLSCQLIYLT